MTSTVGLKGTESIGFRTMGRAADGYWDAVLPTDLLPE
jgi:hypothetical protein